jgi:AcrR family transcriptional regulator
MTGANTMDGPGKGKGGPGKRLTPEDRKAQIVQNAIRYFAAHGFGASTRELAREVGISQPLLYRYFPNKEALVDHVYNEVYLSRWNPAWERRLADRSVPLRVRLCSYYKDYAAIILKDEWTRIFIFAGLTREGLNTRYLAHLRGRIFELVLAELRHEYAIAAPSAAQLEQEVELIWGMHAAIFYVGMRKWVYGLVVPDDIERLVEHKVSAFLAGTPQVMRELRQAPC